MSSFPIWMTQEQADRLTGEVKAAGFKGVVLQDCSGVLVVAALVPQTTIEGEDGNEEELFQIRTQAENPENLANVVFNLKKQRDSRKGEGKDLAQEPEET